jgi:hypothetical protein
MSAQFAILRTAKLKTLGNIGGSLAHTYRTRETTNADPSRTGDNEHSHGTPGEVAQALKDRLPDKRRKDAVLGLEFFVGGSPEWFEGKTRQQQNAYFHEALGWLEKRHGKDNVVGWSIHRDESTPHLVAYVVPLDAKGKLNAKQWTGGTITLSRMQTDFAKTVGERHGLHRGIEGSRAHHQSIKDFYAQIEKPAPHVTISPETVQARTFKAQGFTERIGLTKRIESPEMVAERVTEAVREAYRPAVESAKLAVSERRRADEMAKTAQSLAKDKKALQQELEGLRKHFAPLLELANLARQEFLELVANAQERVKTIKAEQIRDQKRLKMDQERQRRIKDLERVASKTVGASRTFAKHALEAIEQAGGKAQLVAWRQVEKTTAMEALREGRQTPRDVLAALATYSPGLVDPGGQEAARAYLSKLAGKELTPVRVQSTEKDIGL